MKQEINAKHNGMRASAEPVLAGPYDQLMSIAKRTCADEGIVLESAAAQQVRALICYWCSTCKRTHPLTDLNLKKRRKVCRVCNTNVKLYSSSNKFGKIRRRIFHRYVETLSNNGGLLPI
jgi:hypothetical protein